jgi:3-hydroxybutyryl-CoA dehydratase
MPGLYVCGWPNRGLTPAENRLMIRRKPPLIRAMASAMSHCNPGMTASKEPAVIDFRQRAAQGLQAGDRFTLSRCFGVDDIRRFAELSRDYNPVHVHAEYAAARQFRAPVSHGLLTASLVTEIGGQIGWLAASMTFSFKAPVYAGDTITAHWVIQNVDNQGRAEAEVTLTNTEGTVVLLAQTRGVLPNAQQRSLLTQMLAAGDPDNGATAPPDPTREPQ